MKSAPADGRRAIWQYGRPIRPESVARSLPSRTWSANENRLCSFFVRSAAIQPQKMTDGGSNSESSGKDGS